MKYESPITYHSKDMANVKVFEDRQTNRRTGQKLFVLDLSIPGHENFHYRIKNSFHFYSVCE
jgi:hypothetical protein